MALNYEEWCEKIKPAIDNAGDSATVVTVLTDARDEYRELFSENTALTEELEKTRAENERLKDTNRELFLRIGQQMTERPGQPTKEGRAETIKISDLFKED